MSSSRMLPVPDALVGERVDAALARMLGLSRSRCAELCAAGLVLINAVSADKSARLGADDVIEVTIPEPENKPAPATDMDPGGRAPPFWVTSRQRGIALPATAPPNARASSTAWTSEPPGQ